MGEEGVRGKTGCESRQTRSIFLPLLVRLVHCPTASSTGSHTVPATSTKGLRKDMRRVDFSLLLYDTPKYNVLRIGFGESGPCRRSISLGLRHAGSAHCSGDSRPDLSGHAKCRCESRLNSHREISIDAGVKSTRPSDLGHRDSFRVFPIFRGIISCKGRSGRKHCYSAMVFFRNSVKRSRGPLLNP